MAAGVGYPPYEDDPVKREAGENPARTRHRNYGARKEYVTEKSGRPFCALIFKPGDLPVCRYKKSHKLSRRYRNIYLTV